MGSGSEQIPFIRYISHGGGGVPTNIGEIIRNAEHDRLLAASRRFRGVDPSALSDYEYFRAVCTCFADWDGTLTAEVDKLMLQSVFGIPEEPSPENCDTLWAECNAVIAEQPQDNDTTFMDLYRYSVTPDGLSADTLAEQERVICDGIAQFARHQNALVCLSGRMPAVFRRPDPHHAELAFRKCLCAKQTPEERDLLFAQLLRTAARQCAEYRIPLLFENLSPDFGSFYRYLRTEAGEVVTLARIDEVSFRYLGESAVYPVVSDAVAAERLLPYLPAVSLIYLPASDARDAFAHASQLCFRRPFSELTENKKHGAKNCIRAVCYDNLSAIFAR